MPHHDPARFEFTITGEASAGKLAEIERFIAGLGVVADIDKATQASPSILLEKIDTLKRASELAVTEDSVEQYFRYMGMQERALARESRQYVGGLLWHLQTGHYGRYGNDDGCPCPLESVEGYQFGSLQDVGLEPVSFIQFATRDAETIEEQLRRWGNKLHRFGPRRVQVLRQMGYHLASELGIEVDGEV